MLAFLTAIAAKIALDPRDAEIRALKAKIDDLNRELTETRVNAIVDCNAWRAMAES
jgi:hypothetical protein